MTRARPWLFAALAAALAAGAATMRVGAQQQPPSSAEVLMGAALHQEEVEGNLEAAIMTYQNVIADPRTSRALAARAQFRIGMCYERLGKAEARKAYETVLREYANQTDLTAQARARLAALGQPANGATASGMAVRRMWAGGIVHQLSAVSRDGRYFSYRDLARDLNVRDLVSGETYRLTRRAALSIGQPSLPRFSPDNRQIVFNWQRGEGFDDLLILRFDARPVGTAAGSEPRVLYSTRGEGRNTHIHPEEWSADGKYILASRFGPTDRTSQIVLVSVADGSVRVLKTLDWRSPLKMSLSPDGRYIAYDLPKENSPARDIFVLPTAEGREVPLVEHRADDRLLGWAPDGEQILFSSNRTGMIDAWVIPVVDGKPQGTPTRVKRDIGQVKPLGFTRSGSFYYGLDTEHRDLYIAPLDPETGKVLVSPARVERAGANARPAWSADGQYLAYLSSQGPISRMSPVIVIRSLTTGEEREITPALNQIALGETNLYVLRWSPDGRHLLASGRDEKNRQGLFQIDAKTGDTTPIVYSNPGGNVASGRWSLDGKAIFYIRRDLESSLPVGRIVWRDLETRQEKELYRLSVTPTALDRLFLSPDGRWLAFNQSQQPSPRLSIMIMPAGGGEARELPLPRPQDNSEVVSDLAGWTPDSRQLLFMRRPAFGGPGASSELWRISADGGEPHKLGLTITALSPDLSIHPDGRRVAFSTFLPKIEVWAMENFLPPLGANR